MEKFWGLLLSCTPGLPHTVPCCTNRDHDGEEEEEKENKEEDKGDKEDKENLFKLGNHWKSLVASSPVHVGTNKVLFPQ